MISRFRIVLCGVLLATPELAFAHFPIKGINNFYNGLLHPLFVPSHLLLLVASGLCIGQQEIITMRKALGGFCACTAIGILASGFVADVRFEPFLLGSAAVLSIFVSLNLGIKPYGCLAIGALAGLLIGFDSAQETLSGTNKLLSLVGTFIVANLLFLYLIGLTDFCKRKAWQRVGVRIIGSWTAASALMVLALLITQTPAPEVMPAQAEGLIPQRQVFPSSQ